MNRGVVGSEKSVGKRVLKGERGWEKEEIGDGGAGYIRIEGGAGDINPRSVLVTQVERG